MKDWRLDAMQVDLTVCVLEKVNDATVDASSGRIVKIARPPRMVKICY